jgi:hypothetical protein
MSEAHGRIVADNGPDRRGGTLATATLSGDTEIVLEDATDFDEQENDRRWLVIADSAPIAYTDVDDDTDTVTIVGTVGAAYEAGVPVDVWDPTVKPNGGKVIDHKVSVELENGVHPGVILRHEMIPAAGVDNLIGASVTIEDDGNDEGWEVAKVHGRDALLDQSYFNVPFITLYQAANVAVSSSAFGTTLVYNAWTIDTETPEAFEYDAVDGLVTVLQPGLYLFTLGLTWAGNSTGKRTVDLVTVTGGVGRIRREEVGSPPDAQVYTQQITVVCPMAVGDAFQMQVQQSSGANLNIRGDSEGRYTQLQAVRLQA